MNKIAVIEGLRTPFIKSWTDFNNLNSLELSKLIVDDLIKKTNLPKEQISELIFGTVFHPVYSPNIAREVVLASDLPKHIPGFTVTRACASGIQAITCAVEAINKENDKVVIAGGVESISQMDLPVTDKIKRFLFDLSQTDNLEDYKEKALKLIPKIPRLAEISTGYSMGEYADLMAKENNILRIEQDTFALNSHLKAYNAFKNGYLKDEVAEINALNIDNNIRYDSSLEALAKLKAVFSKDDGTVTAGNSSPLTDGAAAMILMSEEKAKSLGYTPKAIIKDYVYTAIDTRGQMLMGNAYSIPKLLKRNNLKLSDIDFFEMHEAFAAQALSNLQALNSDKFAIEELNENHKIGEIPPEKLNIYGGSVAIGHPFGATGIRLINTMSNILKRHNKKYGIVSVCAAGGISASVLLENNQE